MARWKLFGKPKEEVTTEDKKTVEDKPMTLHSETLYTGASGSKKSGAATSSGQSVWRNVDSIEREVDDLQVKRSGSSSDVDKTVDKLIYKRKKK